MSAPRRVLVVSFFYPPDAAVGGRRVSKFVEYLPQFGWAATVLTALTVPGAPPPTDGEPPVYRALRHVLPMSSVRMPDATLGWVPFAVAEGQRLLKDRGFDAILSSAGPPSSHIVAARRQRHGLRDLANRLFNDYLGLSADLEGLPAFRCFCPPGPPSEPMCSP